MIWVHVSTEQGYCRWCHTTYWNFTAMVYASASMLMLLSGQWTNAALVSHHVPSLCLVAANGGISHCANSKTHFPQKIKYQTADVNWGAVWDDCLCAVCCMFVVHSHMTRSNIISVKVLVIISGTHQLLHLWHAIGQVRWQLLCEWTDRQIDRSATWDINVWR